MSLKRSPSPELWLPKSYDELKSLGEESLIYKSQGESRIVRRTAPGVFIKYGGYDLAEEVRAMEFVGCKTSIPIPRIIHVPSGEVWYICMTEARGTSLDKCIMVHICRSQGMFLYIGAFVLFSPRRFTFALLLLSIVYVFHLFCILTAHPYPTLTHDGLFPIH
ncbi:hypothetical protein JB92DRAFT_61833 [Gautieria morchelliformis]|nr:hypothetical protein JB92DRAFT_61833 [Gautieria morchelliformis]